jgi:hypothetical protein
MGRLCYDDSMMCGCSSICTILMVWGCHGLALAPATRCQQQRGRGGMWQHHHHHNNNQQQQQQQWRIYWCAGLHVGDLCVAAGSAAGF